MKTILVTGGASGIGKNICETFLKKGYTVFATDINKELLNRFNGTNIIPIEMDVTDEKSITNAYNEINKRTEKLDVLVNNAGISRMASLIETDIKIIEKIMDINLLGMIRVNKIFFPLIQKEKGRIINISSENGWLKPAPFNGPYTISKYAVEAYNDSLRRELNFLGIKVIKIQPGSFKTAMHDDTIKYFNELKESTVSYKKQINKMGSAIERELKNANDMKCLMDVIVEAAENLNPKLCYRVKNSPQMKIMNLFSDRKIDNLYLKSLN